MTTAQKRIGVAFLAGAVLVSGSLFLKQSVNAESKQAALLVTAAPERSFIDVVDRNNNGIPDWQEALQSTSPLMLPGEDENYEYAPSTLTEEFGVAFFENYVRSKGYGVFGVTEEELIERSSGLLADKATDELFTIAHITLGEDNQPAALKTYGNAVAVILNRYAAQGDSELVILGRAMRNNDPDELDRLQPLVDSYDGMVRDMLALRVPSQYVGEHLDIINTFNALAIDIEAMRNAYEDPISALIRLKRYEEDAIGMSAALINLYDRLKLEGGVTFGPNEPAYSLTGWFLR